MPKNNRRLQDKQGLKVTTGSSEAIAITNEFVHQILSHGSRSSIILEGVKADPACVIVNSHAAVFYLLTETAGAPSQAAPYLSTAKTHLADASEREQLYFWQSTHGQTEVLIEPLPTMKKSQINFLAI